MQYPLDHLTRLSDNFAIFTQLWGYKIINGTSIVKVDGWLGWSIGENCILYLGGGCAGMVEEGVEKPTKSLIVVVVKFEIKVNLVTA